MNYTLTYCPKSPDTNNGGYRYFFNGQEGDNEVFGEMANFGYEFRQYDSRLGRWWSVDPMNGKYPSMSPYTYCSDNPLILKDIDGNDWVKVNSQWQWNENIHSIDQALAAGYDDYLPCGSIVDNASINGQFGEKGKTSVYLGFSMNDISFTYPNKTVTPWQVGQEWLIGQGPRERNFNAGDLFTELLRNHQHIKDLLVELSQKLRSGSVSVGNVETKNYNLSGVEGVGKYLKDYSTLLTLGKFGNLAVTYLGSYQLTWSIIQIDDNIATIGIFVSNESTMQSATRPPVIGYTGLWKNTIGDIINEWFNSGPCSKTKQKFYWTETISF